MIDIDPSIVNPFVEVELPIRIEPEMNKRDHAIARNRRFADQKKAVFYVLASVRGVLRLIVSKGAVLVTLTRIGPRSLDDDNLVSGFKGVRDQVADMLGINDGDRKRIRFICEQETGRKHGARVRIESVGVGR